MSSAVTDNSIRHSAQVQTEPDIIFPEDADFSGLCRLTATDGEYILGFESNGFAVDHKRALAKLTADAVGLVEDPDWVKLVTNAGLDKKYALNIAEMGLLLQVFRSTGMVDAESGKPSQSLAILGLTTPYCGHSADLLHNVGAVMHTAYTRYAKAAGLPTDFTNIELSRERGLPAAKSQYTYIEEFKKKNNGQSPCDERVFAYFSGWTTPAGYMKLKAIQDELTINEQKYFGTEAQTREIKVQKANPLTGKMQEVISYQRDSAVALLSHVSGYVAGYEKVREMTPELASEGFETRIIRMQHASEIARYKACDQVLKKYSGIEVYANEIRRISLLTPNQYSIVDMDTVSDYFRTKSA